MSSEAPKNEHNQKNPKCALILFRKVSYILHTLNAYIFNLLFHLKQYPLSFECISFNKMWPDTAVSIGQCDFPPLVRESCFIIICMHVELNGSKHSRTGLFRVSGMALEFGRPSWPKPLHVSAPFIICHCHAKFTTTSFPSRFSRDKHKVASGGRRRRRECGKLYLQGTVRIGGCFFSNSQLIWQWFCWRKKMLKFTKPSNSFSSADCTINVG